MSDFSLRIIGFSGRRGGGGGGGEGKGGGSRELLQGGVLVLLDTSAVAEAVAVTTLWAPSSLVDSYRRGGEDSSFRPPAGVGDGSVPGPDGFLRIDLPGFAEQ